MCFASKPKPIPKTQPKPQPSADPTEIGEVRKAEDESLFGGVPDLRYTDNSLTGGGLDAGGSGLALPEG